MMGRAVLGVKESEVLSHVDVAKDIEWNPSGNSSHHTKDTLLHVLFSWVLGICWALILPVQLQDVRKSKMSRNCPVTKFTSHLPQGALVKCLPPRRDVPDKLVARVLVFY
jgi:hypothetical protein